MTEQDDAAHDDDLVDMRRRFEGLISELLVRDRAQTAYALADMAVREGVWDNRWQRPVYLHPTSESQPFLDGHDVWFLDHLERNWPRMRAEVDEVTDPDSAGFSSAGLDGMSVIGTGWRQLMLWDRGTRFDGACERFPVVAEIVEAIPEATTGGTGFVMLSWLHPGTRLAPHCGPTNVKARTHFGIRAAAGASIRVADEVRTWQDGRGFTFDDSFEHEVWHDGDEPRIVLILDTPHPLLIDPERAVRSAQSHRGDEVRSFMQSMGLRHVGREGDLVSVEFDGAMLDFMRSYLDTREIRRADLRDGVLTLG